MAPQQPLKVVQIHMTHPVIVHQITGSKLYKQGNFSRNSQSIFKSQRHIFIQVRNQVLRASYQMDLLQDERSDFQTIANLQSIISEILKRAWRNLKVWSTLNFADQIRPIQGLQKRYMVQIAPARIQVLGSMATFGVVKHFQKVVWTTQFFIQKRYTNLTVPA